MGQVTGAIQSIGEKNGTGKTGKPYTMYSVKVNGDWHNAGFDKPSYGEGQTVSFEMEQNGQYQNMKKGSMIAAAGGAVASAPAAHVPGEASQRDLQIMRQNAVTNANAFAAHQNWEGDHEGIIDIARVFVDFYTGKLDVAKAEDEFNGEDIPF